MMPGEVIETGSYGTGWHIHPHPGYSSGNFEENKS